MKNKLNLKYKVIIIASSSVLFFVLLSITNLSSPSVMGGNVNRSIIVALTLTLTMIIFSLIQYLRRRQ
jgi:hypothetical protein